MSGLAHTIKSNTRVYNDWFIIQRWRRHQKTNCLSFERKRRGWWIKIYYYFNNTRTFSTKLRLNYSKYSGTTSNQPFSIWGINHEHFSLDEVNSAIGRATCRAYPHFSNPDPTRVYKWSIGRTHMILDSNLPDEK